MEHGHADAPHREHEHPEFNIDIVVNGVAEVWHHHEIDFEEVVKLAFPDDPAGENVRYSVTWTKPNGDEGSLRPGHAIGVVKDMMFDVRNTDKS